MRNEKQYLLDEVVGIIEDESPSFLVTRYEGMKADLSHDFRTELEKHDGSIEVTKKRVCQKAFDKLGIEIDVAGVPGHVALVILGKDDPLGATKATFKFSKANGDVVEVMAGRIDGENFNKDQVKQLSTLPGKDEMRAQFLSLLEAPMADTLSVFQAILASVVYCIDNKVKQEESK